MRVSSLASGLLAAHPVIAKAGEASGAGGRVILKPQPEPSSSKSKKVVLLSTI